MPEWYDAAPPNVEEVAKKEFGTLIFDDPEFVGTIDTADVISSWVEEEAWKSTYAASVKSAPYTLKDLAEFKMQPWQSHWISKWMKGGQDPQWHIDVGGWELPDYSYPDEYTSMVQFPKYYVDGGSPLVKCWEGLNPYSNGGMIEPRTPLPHQCHCLRDRHLEPLRQRVADMLSRHRFDVDYDANTDDSPIICVGSETYGPNRPPATSSYHYTVTEAETQTFVVGPTWTEMAKQAEKAHLDAYLIKEDEALAKALYGENLTINAKTWIGDEE